MQGAQRHGYRPDASDASGDHHPAVGVENEAKRGIGVRSKCSSTHDRARARGRRPTPRLYPDRFTYATAMVQRLSDLGIKAFPVEPSLNFGERVISTAISRGSGGRRVLVTGLGLWDWRPGAHPSIGQAHPMGNYNYPSTPCKLRLSERLNLEQPEHSMYIIDLMILKTDTIGFG